MALPELKIFNPAEIDAQIQREKAGQMQNKLAELALGQQQRAVEQENALMQVTRNAFDPATGRLDPAKYRQGLGQAGDYKGLQKFETDQATLAKTQREAEKEQIATAKSQLELIGQVAGGIQDQNSYTAGLKQLASYGVKVDHLPQQYDPALVAREANKAQTRTQQLDQYWKKQNYDLDTAKFGENQRHNRTQEGIAGANLAVARGNLGLRQQELTAGGKAPAGYRWKPDGSLESIPGGPGDKLPESQQKQVVGVNNLSSAISEYRTELAGFGGWSKLSPDDRAKMGTKYNNMMLQAKEAYNLGVLNGPDLEILTNVITDPRSAKAILLSKDALDTQASELDRMMQGVGKVSGQAKQPQNKPGATGNGASPGKGGLTAEEQKELAELRKRLGK